ncbi:MAG: Ger(x)C family spore germination protein [Bacilli bacterium]|nr:Ger(x)C family spore germination protein [Bacilli bacterium]
MKKFILIIPLLCLLTGCYNYRELNDLAIISGVAVSKVEDTYKITAEVVNPKKEQDTSSGKEPDYVIYEGSGSSMQEAFRNIVKESPQKLYGAQMDILIIDEQTAKEGIDDILDFFARDPEIRSEFYVLISKSDKTLKVITPLVNISSKNIMNSLESTNTYLGTANLITYHQLIDDFLNPHIEIALPSIEMIGDTNIGETTENIETSTTDATNIISNMTVFKDGKLIGYLNESESLAYNIITNNSQTILIKNDYNDNKFIINEVIDSSTEMKTNVKKKQITITIKGKASISDVNYDVDLEKEITKIQKKLNNTVEDLIEETITNTTKKYNSDIYGFKDLLYKTNPKEYKKIIKDSEQDFLKDLYIKVKSNIEIIEKGNLNGGIYHE